MSGKLLIVLAFVISLLVGTAFEAGTLYEGKKNAIEMAKVQKQAAEDVAALTAKIREQENHYVAQIAILNDRITEATTQYKASIDKLRADADDKLRDSEARATRYKQLSEAGSGGCSSVADTAGRLDRLITQGVGLVEELEGTVKVQRAINLQLIGKMQSDVEFINKHYDGTH